MSITTPPVRRHAWKPLPPHPSATTSYRFELVPMSHSVLFDLESYAIDRVADFIEPVSAPGNYKNEATIATYIEEATRKAIAKAALKPDLARIVALSWMKEDRDTEPRVFTCKDEREEAAHLRTFWDDLVGDAEVHHRVVTFGGHRFDLPMLMRRSQVLGVEYPRLRVDRMSPHLDLYRVMTFDDAIDGYSLQFYCKRYELSVPCQDDVSGADIARLVEAGAWDQVANHCTADVWRLHALAEWLGVINRHMEVEQPF